MREGSASTKGSVQGDVAAGWGRAGACNDAGDDPADVDNPAAFGRLRGVSSIMRDVIERLQRIAARDTTLLLEGASGTGKELAAHAVHEAGARSDKPFVVVDCGALPRTLIEAELFGHERGAYTGATQAREGAFVRAQGGTVFLDEIGELDLDVQPRLLGVIERREVKPLGGSKTRRVDVRIVAATNRDLRREVDRGVFRADLYYRLAVSCVRLPDLRERREDIPVLCRHIVNDLAARDGTSYALDDEQIARLLGRAWPGNVRELRNVVEQLVSFGGEAAATSAPAPEPRRRTDYELAAYKPPGSFHEAKAQVVSTFEREYLTDILDQHAGNITAAAQAAGVDRVHFLRLLDRHGLRRSQRG
jgi:DNA-binding NtrC family response regulator